MPRRPGPSPRSTSIRESYSATSFGTWVSGDGTAAMTRVFVSGAIANKPGNGGGAWTRMSYVIGFRRLGFETYFVEQIGPGLCTDQWGSITSFSDSINRRHFREVVNSFGVAGAAALVGPSERMEGMSYADLLEAADGADLLVNISGHLSVPRLRRAFRRAVYIDLDPGFTQIWHAQGNQGPRLAGHDAYFTVGTNVGTAACAIPIDGIQWIPTLPPVVLEDWPVHDTPEPHRFTTIAAWRGPFGPVTHDGRTYGLKVHEFRKVAALPQRTGRCCSNTGGGSSIPSRLFQGQLSSAATCMARGPSSRWLRGSTWTPEVAGSATARSDTWPPGSPYWFRTQASAGRCRLVKASSPFERWTRPWPTPRRSLPTTSGMQRRPERLRRSTSTLTEFFPRCWNGWGCLHEMALVQASDPGERDARRRPPSGRGHMGGAAVPAGIRPTWPRRLVHRARGRRRDAVGLCLALGFDHRRLLRGRRPDVRARRASGARDERSADGRPDVPPAS